jgi:hypothetical protein
MPQAAFRRIKHTSCRHERTEIGHPDILDAKRLPVDRTVTVTVPPEAWSESESQARLGAVSERTTWLQVRWPRIRG